MAEIPGGLLVAVEGIDGAGKTTLVQRLRAEIARMDVPVVSAKEPTQGPHGAKLRATAESGRLPAAEELALLLADRAQHVAEVIGPTLQQGGVVILDRYFYSNIAYQGAAGLDPVDVLRRNLEIAPVPDLVLLLDLPVAEGLRRIGARGDSANLFEHPEPLEAARALFLRYLPAAGVVIDATADADTVFAEAMKRVIHTLSAKFARQAGATPFAAEGLRAVIGPALFA